MTYWFGTFAPESVIIDAYFFQIRWYGMLIVTAILCGFFISRARFRKNFIDEQLVDIAFYAVLGGFVGARLWHVFVFQWNYYSNHLVEIFKIWEGGVAIQGAIIGALLVLYFYSKRKKIKFLALADFAILGLPLGQAIARWGNFFNQELYGRPTSLPWALYIDEAHRLPTYEQYSYYHPVFFYESVLNIILFMLLWRVSNKARSNGMVSALYLCGYGVIRFVADFVRIDPMPQAFGLRLSQLISLLFIACAVLLWFILRERVRSLHIAK